MVEASKPTDLAILRDSWRKSYRLSPRTAKWPNEAYAVWIAQHMDKLLPRCRVAVARPPDWSDGIVGWVAAEQTADKFCVHYAYTIDMFRRQGVMTSLIAFLEPSGQRVFSALRPPFSDALKRSGFVFDRNAA